VETILFFYFVDLIFSLLIVMKRIKVKSWFKIKR